MSKKIFLLFSALFFMLSLNAQLNTTLVSHVDYTKDNKGNGNDIWGYVAPDGTEYGIVGTTQGTLIYELSDPTNPKEVKYIPGSNSTWRDMKAWKEHVYVTCDAGDDGLLIINMEGAPENIEFKFIKPEVKAGDDVTIKLDRCHNIYMDENGIMYLAGCQGRNTEMFDVEANQWDPVYINSIISPYSHDDFVKGDTLYASQLTEDFAIYDLSDKNNPVLMGTIETTSDFTHNAWTDPEHKYAFTTDEKAFGRLDAYDISQPDNIEMLDSWAPKGDNSGIIPHNTHYLNGYLVTSWYTSGLIVIDGNRPTNLVKVAEYDTYGGPDGGFSGMWGTTPFLPSGLVIANDINSGFYVFNVDYKRACYLEGTVTNQSTGETISNVSLSYDDETISEENTKVNGFYDIGRAQPGQITVTYKHPDYITKSVTYDLVTGEVVNGDVALVSKVKYNIDVNAFDLESNDPIDNAQVLLVNEETQYEVLTNTNGVASVSVPEGSYTIYVGKWGHREAQKTEISVPQITSVDMKLDEEYYDSYLFDLGWTVTSTANAGIWERGIPNGTEDDFAVCNVKNDVDNDFGEEAYVTGNADTQSISADDVDGGTTILKSPLMTFEEGNIYSISMNYWFVNVYGNGNPDDKLIIELNNGTDKITLYEHTAMTQFWSFKTIDVSSSDIDFTDNMQVEIRTYDLGEGNIVEAAIDKFRVVATPNSNKNIVYDKINIYPNPSKGQIKINNIQLIEDIVVYDVLSRKVKEINNVSNEVLNLNDLSAGQYILELSLKNNEVQRTNVTIID